MLDFWNGWHELYFPWEANRLILSSGRKKWPILKALGDISEESKQCAMTAHWSELSLCLLEVRSSIFLSPHSPHPNRVGEQDNERHPMSAQGVSQLIEGMWKLRVQTSFYRWRAWKSDRRLTFSGLQQIWTSCWTWQEPICAFLPSSAFKDIMLVAWNWSRWECLHHGTWQMLQIRVISSPENWFTSNQQHDSLKAPLQAHKEPNYLSIFVNMKPNYLSILSWVVSTCLHSLYLACLLSSVHSTSSCGPLFIYQAQCGELWIKWWRKQQNPAFTELNIMGDIGLKHMTVVAINKRFRYML